jgi:hypothetical protein
MDAADTSVRDPEQLRQYAPTLPILASIPHTKFTHGPTNGPKAEA